MTYYNDGQAAEADSTFNPAAICMCCGEPPAGPTVGYDLVMPETGTSSRVLFHRDCAFAMAQRIIMDAWPNRRDGEFMRNDR